MERTQARRVQTTATTGLGLAAGLLACAGALTLLPLSPSQRISMGVILALVAHLAWLARVSDRAFRRWLVVPCLVIMVCITIVPIVYLVWLGLHEVTIANFLKHKPFVGARNYISLLLDDPLFVPTLVRSLQLLVTCIALQLGLGLGLALVCNREFKLRPLVTTILLLPVMTTSIVVGMLWKSMLAFHNGFINLVLHRMGVAPQPWLTNEGLPLVRDLPYVGAWLVQTLNFNYAFLSIVLTNTWQWTPMVFLLLWAGLAALPPEVFEAARVDGAGAWQTLRYVTLPMLAPVIAVVIVIRGIDIMKIFGMIWAMFGNAPITRTLNIHIHTIGVTSHNYGSGAALSLLASVIAIALFMTFQGLLVERERAR